MAAPDFGYSPEPYKTVLVVNHVQHATTLFADFGVKVVSGSRLLGGFVGDHTLMDDFVSKKVLVWLQCVQTLSEVTVHQPQAACSC